MDKNEERAVENLVLAVARTELANRRTLLAYLNTSIALFVSGAGLLKLSGSPWLEILGTIFMPVSLVVATIGIVDYRILRKDIESERVKLQDEASADDSNELGDQKKS
ncbi:MAG: hypothetical protein MnENMB40S_25260 [Rhizobiaceae bacterium MnEN-MB40S]|nr:MAG: hypothetical protein MnENMB40S_25260 [Rhizobiaceae bacterium MnEN-MB40S]